MGNQTSSPTSQTSRVRGQGLRVEYAKGFTLLEVIIAIAILAVVMGTTTPILVKYYSNYRIITAQHNLVSVLRKAQSLAMTNQYESSFGVSVAFDRYIVFRGASYASRMTDFDEEVLYSQAIVISGPSEIVFAQLSGRPNATGTITLTGGDFSKNIIVNDEGALNW